MKRVPPSPTSYQILINPKFLPIVQIWHLRTSPGRSRLLRKHAARNSASALVYWPRCRSVFVSGKNRDLHRAIQDPLHAFEATHLPALVALRLRRPNQLVTEPARGDPARPLGLRRVASSGSKVNPAEGAPFISRSGLDCRNCPHAPLSRPNLRPRSVCLAQTGASGFCSPRTIW
jgi:hypothetical protein